MGQDDPENPENWLMKRKWTASVPMSLFDFLAAMSSATAAPAFSTIQKDLNIKSNTLLIMVLSIYFLGRTITPFFAAPLSEIFERLVVLQSSNLFYIVFNTIYGAANSQNELIAFRFLAGMGGAGPQTLGTGIDGGLFQPHERGKAVAIYTLTPLLRTIIGPIAGGFLVQYVSWRWCFYIVSVARAAVQVFGFVIFYETYAPVFIQGRCKKLRQSTGNNKLYMEYDSIVFSTLIWNSSIQPLKVLLTQPTVQITSFYIAYLDGNLYLMVATFLDVWTNIYR